MIFELASSIIVGGLVYRCVSLAVETTRAGARGVNKRRWAVVSVANQGTAGRFGPGDQVMRLLPAAWAKWLVGKFGPAAKRDLAAAGLADTTVQNILGTRLLLMLAAFSSGPLMFRLSGPALFFGLGAAAIAGELDRHQLKTRARFRREAFSALMPDFLNLLSIAVEAGMSLDRAVRIYCEKFNNPVGEAFSVVMSKIDVGKPRRAAFEEMARESGISELVWLVSAVSQSEKLGAPLASALKGLAAAGRNRQKDLVKVATAAAPIKMLFPIAGLILPSLLLVIIGPALLQFLS